MLFRSAAAGGAGATATSGAGLSSAGGVLRALGGGAGGFVYNPSFDVSVNIYAITVGSGGAGGYGDTASFSLRDGWQGTPSKFSSIDASGGGGGRAYANNAGRSNGASGGGAGMGTKTWGGLGISGQGYHGGAGDVAVNVGGGVGGADLRDSAGGSPGRPARGV